MPCFFNSEDFKVYVKNSFFALGALIVELLYLVVLVAHEHGAELLVRHQGLSIQSLHNEKLEKSSLLQKSRGCS